VERPFYSCCSYINIAFFESLNGLYKLPHSILKSQDAPKKTIMDHKADQGYFLHKTTDGRVAPRSGLASKHFIDTGAGVIDADYRGQVKVLLFNHSDANFPIAEGDRVAQLIIERIYTPEVVEVAELEESVRGAGGFGSTGTN
jgi:dUTPase